jgi:hypothetical protein
MSKAFQLSVLKLTFVVVGISHTGWLLYICSSKACVLTNICAFTDTPFAPPIHSALQLWDTFVHRGIGSTTTTMDSMCNNLLGWVSSTPMYTGTRKEKSI